MQCFYCFAELPEGSTVCECCGTQLVTENRQQEQQSYSQSYQPRFQQSYNQPYQSTYQQTYGQPAQNNYQRSYQQSYGQSYGQSGKTKFRTVDKPMGWFYFLIYIGLFYSAISYVKMGYEMLTGAQYGRERELYYLYYKGLEGADKFFGICVFAMAGLAIVARFSLANYRERGPKLLIALYIAAIVVSLGYILAVKNVLGSDFEWDSSFISYGISLGYCIIMTLVNIKYFGNRDHIFVE